MPPIRTAACRQLLGRRATLHGALRAQRAADQRLPCCCLPFAAVATLTGMHLLLVAAATQAATEARKAPPTQAAACPPPPASQQSSDEGLPPALLRLQTLLADATGPSAAGQQPSAPRPEPMAAHAAAQRPHLASPQPALQRSHSGKRRWGEPAGNLPRPGGGCRASELLHCGVQKRACLSRALHALLVHMPPEEAAQLQAARAFLARF